MVEVSVTAEDDVEGMGIVIAVEEICPCLLVLR
jgi:hypothetical protein